MEISISIRPDISIPSARPNINIFPIFQDSIRISRVMKAVKKMVVWTL